MAAGVLVIAAAAAAVDVPLAVLVGREVVGMEVLVVVAGLEVLVAGLVVVLAAVVALVVVLAVVVALGVDLAVVAFADDVGLTRSMVVVDVGSLDVAVEATARVDVSGEDEMVALDASATATRLLSCS